MSVLITTVMTRAILAVASFVAVIGLASAAVSKADIVATMQSGAIGLIAFEGPSLEIMRPDGSDRRHLSRLNVLSFAWSPDGSKIALQSGQGLFLVNIDGSGERLLSRDCNEARMSWSPDGTRIACAYGSLSPARSGIGVVRVDNSTFTALTRHRDSFVDYAPDWSPDGTSIAFVRRRGDDHSLAVMNADGTGVRFLTPRGFYSGDPDWSPDPAKDRVRGRAGKLLRHLPGHLRHHPRRITADEHHPQSHR